MRLDEYYANVSVGKELCHHGVKGQAWGVTNGPPYPLNGEGKKEFKENKKILKSKEAQTLREKAAARHGKAEKANQAIIKSKTETSKEKLKQVQAKTDVQKAKQARHAIKDARRKEKLAAKRDAEKLKAEMRAMKRKEQADIKAQRKKEDEEYTAQLRKEGLEAAKTKAEISKARAAQNEAQLKQLKDLANSIPKADTKAIKESIKNIKTPKDVLRERVINSGDKKMVKKYRSILSNEDLRAAQARIDLVKELRGSKIEKLKTLAGNIKDVTGKAKDAADNTINVLNNVGATARVFAPHSRLAKLKIDTTIGPKPNKEIVKLTNDLKIAALKADIAALNSGNDAKYLKNLLGGGK